MNMIRRGLARLNPVDRSPAAGGGETLYSIGDMAREYGVSLRALRFYEDRGLLQPLRQGQARYYRARERIRLQLILKGKALGFTLTEIRELLDSNQALEDPQAREPQFEAALRPEQIEAQIDHLERQRRDIDDAILRLRETRQRLWAAV